ncbi:hypothetical protein [Streptomyces sp. NPDC051994]
MDEKRFTAPEAGAYRVTWLGDHDPDTPVVETLMPNDEWISLPAERD